MTKLITSQYKRHFGGLMVDSVLSAAKAEYRKFASMEGLNTYYLFTAKHIDRIGAISTPQDSTREAFTNVYREMIFGKKITENDIQMVMRNIPYVSNKVYTMYDDRDATMLANDFYCVVDETSYFHVYKCLDNNLGANSTVAPQFAHIVGSNTSIYQTADGYRWKYMFSISDSQYDKFATDSHIPFIVNNEVRAAAVEGSLEIIKIDLDGKNYNNYTSGAFVSSDLRVGGNTNVYAVSNNSVKTTNGYYTGCLIYLSAGIGAGQYRTITDYYSNNDGNYIVVNSQFSIPPENGTLYEINPQVQIVGDGGQSVNAVARALVNAQSSNSIYRIESLNIGRGYKLATANIVANSVVGVTVPAEVRPIIVPAGGHGYKPCCELGIIGYGIGITFSNSESNTIVFENTYDQIGIIKNPTFANVLIQYTSANGIFIQDETIKSIKPIRFQQNATINIESTVVTCNSAEFDTQVYSNVSLYFKSSNGLSHMIGTVNNVINATAFNLTQNATFSCTDVDIHFAHVSASMKHTLSPNNDHVFVTNVNSVIENGDLLVGANSGAKVIISTISRNDEIKGFNTFMQMHKYTAVITAGVFTNDELVYQGSTLSNSTANGYLNSILDPNEFQSTIYVSEQFGNVNTTEALWGSISGAAATVINKYDPELSYGSGEIMYLENIDTVNRTNNQSESIKLIFEF